MKHLAILACFAGLAMICTTLPRTAHAQVLQLSTAQVEEANDAPQDAVLRIGFGPITRFSIEGGLTRFQLPLISLNSREYFSVDKRVFRINMFSPTTGSSTGFSAGPMLNVDFGTRTPFIRGGVPQPGRLLATYRRGTDRIFSGLFVKYAF